MPTDIRQGVSDNEINMALIGDTSMSNDWTVGQPRELSVGVDNSFQATSPAESKWHERCTTWYRRIPMRIERSFIQLWQVIERTPPFLSAIFSRNGLFSADGRQLIVGKFRRFGLSAVPPLARYLQKKYKMTGGCTSCGASCKIMFQCPHWNETTRLCSVYEDRPNICRLFPITPADISDRNIVMKNEPCGFTFKGDE